MKSEKRHELQKNELADWLGTQAEAAADYFWPIVGGIVVAVAAAIGIAWYLGNQDSQASAAWGSYYQAFGERDREAELKKVAEQHGDTAAAIWARQAVADISLSKGASLMFTDRAEAETNLKEAQENYRVVLDKARDPLLLTRAQYGMAKVLETQCKPEEAKKYYEEVAKSAKNTALAKAAERDAQRMARPETIDFLAWFAKQTPKKPVPLGHDFGNPALNLPPDLPERPDISLPGTLNLDSTKLPEGDTKLEFPKPSESPKAEPAGTDAQKTESSKTESPKTEAPKTETPKSGD